MLPGAADGIRFYLEPKWDTLAQIDVWGDAATQIFYSLGPAFGGLITLASYNRFNNNCHRDAILIAIANCSTSVFAGFVIFSIIGFMAQDLGLEVADVIKSGPGLAFVAYPEAVTQLPVPQIWSFLFFMMLITLGLDSQFTMTETLISALLDQWPVLRKKKSLVVIGACSLGFLMGLTMCTNGGVFMFTLIDSYAASWSILLLAIVEIVLVIWVYGYTNFFENIREMEIRLPLLSKYYWTANWLCITPIILSFITVVTWVKFTPCQYGDYVFPAGIQSLGWLMAATPVFIFFAVGVTEVVRRKRAGKPVDFKSMTSPVAKWGPAVKTASSATGEEASAPPQTSFKLSDNAAYTNEAFAQFGYGADKGPSSHM